MSAPTRPAAWAVEDAVEVLPWDAPEELWLAERRNGIGGSDTSAVFGLSPYTSPIALWLDKTGRYRRKVTGLAVEWGHRLEPVVADWFSEQTGIETRRAGLFRSLAYPELQCTPDRLTADAGVEIKTLDHYTEHEWYGPDGEEIIPDHAELQAYKCMAVTGRRQWWVVGLVAGRYPLVRLAEWDDAMVQLIIDTETAWWRDYVLADVMPPLDATTATNDAITDWVGPDDGSVLAADDELLDLYAQLDAAKDAAAVADAAVVALDSQIRLKVGSAAIVALDPAGELNTDRKAGKSNVVARVANNGTFSPKRFTAAHPDLAAEHRRVVEQLDKTALKTKHPDAYRAACARVIRPRKAALADALAARAARRAAAPTTNGEQ
jgi:putative phage-type endonuclease